MNAPEVNSRKEKIAGLRKELNSLDKGAHWGTAAEHEARESNIRRLKQEINDLERGFVRKGLWW